MTPSGNDFFKLFYLKNILWRPPSNPDPAQNGAYFLNITAISAF
ncbi:hypothetical protein VPHK449_0014 [Vibrio phage K449]